jgi:peptidoglycan/LPS O-acetylase OafA/YrhL
MTLLAANSSLHKPELDGLRFFAFLAVFVHHMPQAPFPILAGLKHFGWIGVDLFFVISSYLFFYLFKAEFAKAGRIAIGKFYLRRLLRLYPLMVAAPLLALIASPLPVADIPTAIGRYLGLAVFMDNFLIWGLNYNVTVPWISHLWTLSFEFQVYVVMPFAFLAWRLVGTRRFLAGLLAILVISLIARMAFLLAGIRPRTIWVTPFLRPESILVGLALSMITLRMRPVAVATLGALALTVLLLGPDPLKGGYWLLASYGLVALFCGAIVWLALNVPALSGAMGWRPLAYLGEISFGLYVFHLAAIYFANAWLGGDFRVAAGGWFGLFGASLALCIFLAALSHRYFERPFLALKERASIIVSRPA